MHISDYMNPEFVALLDTKTRDETLRKLVNKIYGPEKQEESDRFYQAILDREKIISTGIGMGVAIPHAKLKSYDHFFIAVAILKKPVDWLALDGTPVRLVFMIGGPDNRQTEYLQILSLLTHAIKDEDLRKKIFTFNKTSDVIELFKSI